MRRSGNRNTHLANKMNYPGDPIMQPFSPLDLFTFRALTSWATLAALVAAIIAISAR